jgi:hypothetical protein
MLAHVAKIVLAAVFVSVASVAQAQPGKVDLEAAEMAVELIGAPVFASDGPEVGEVAGISFDDGGQPLRLRIRTAATLGLGERTVETPQGAFMALRGAVVLDLPVEAVKALPELTEPAGEK